MINAADNFDRLALRSVREQGKRAEKVENIYQIVMLTSKKKYIYIYIYAYVLCI